MNSLIEKLKPKKVLLSISASVLMLVMVIAVLPLITRAEAFEEVNPKLQMAKINGNTEEMKGASPYVQTTEYTDYNDENSGEKYTILTDAYINWFPQDDGAFAYKYYGVKSGGGDFIEVEASVNMFTDKNDGTYDGSAAHHPSTGIMFRSDLTNTASFIMLEVRDGGDVYVVYRDPTYASSLYGCSHQYSSIGVTSEDFPMTFKLFLKGTTVQVSYKGKNDASFKKFTPVSMTGFTKGVYAGVAATSGQQNNPIKATFNSLKISGVASLGDGNTSSGSSSTVSEIVDPDIKLSDSENVLLRETFTDGSLNNEPEGTENPIWKRFPDRGDVSIINIEQNRMLYLEYAAAYDVAGSEKWTDYSVSLDMMFTEDCAEGARNQAGLIVRHTSNDWYGYMDYIVTIEKGHYLTVYKLLFGTEMKTGQIDGNNMVYKLDLREALNDSTFSVLGDGKFHNLKVDCFDNVLTLYFDDEQVGEYTDDGSQVYNKLKHIHGRGQVGIYSDAVYAYVDNLIVRKLQDDLGGDYDNMIGGNWDQPAPDYTN